MHAKCFLPKKKFLNFISTLLRALHTLHKVPRNRKKKFISLQLSMCNEAGATADVVKAFPDRILRNTLVHMITFVASPCRPHQQACTKHHQLFSVLHSFLIFLTFFLFKAHWNDKKKVYLPKFAVYSSGNLWTLLSFSGILLIERRNPNRN